MDKYLKIRAKPFEIFSGACVFIAALLYVLAIWRYSSDIPILDDYDAVLGFLNDFVTASSAKQKIAVIFGQHNEHRLVFNHVITLLFFNLFDEINFKYLIYFGNIGWFAFLYVYWRYAKSIGITFAEFSPAAIILLCFCTSEAMTFATPAIQFHFQTLFTLLALLMMTKGFVFSAMAFVFLSVFTSGGGLLLIPVISLYCLFKMQWRNLLISSLISLVIIFYYFSFLPYSAPSHHPSLLSALSSPYIFILFFFGLLGGIGMINQLGILSAVVLGVGSLAVFLRRLLPIYRTTPLLFWFSIYIFITALATDLSRSGFGLEYSLSSRYTFLGALLLTANYLAYLATSKVTKDRNKISIFGLIFSIAAFSYWFSPGVQHLADLFNASNQKDFVHYPSKEHALNILKKSEKLGIFQPTWLKD